MAIPIGVMTAKVSGMAQFLVLRHADTLSSEEEEEEGSSAAMRAPRARPSNIWWKRMTMKRVMNTESPATTRVMPRRMEWKMIPASRTRTVIVSFGFTEEQGSVL